MSEVSLQSIAGMILELSSQCDGSLKEIKGQLKIIDKRLSLIEQRLSNIEPFISVDNRSLHYEND